MDSNTTPGAGAPDPGPPQSEQAREPVTTPTEPAQDPNDATAPAASDKDPLKRHIRPKTTSKYATKYWKKRIKTELQPPDKEKNASSKKGPSKTPKKNASSEDGLWDPDSYTRTEQDQLMFFSGHRVRPKVLRDRMKFARYAIEASLSEYPPGIVESVKESQSAISRVEAADKSKDILRVVKSEGQREIDAEDPNAGDQKSELDEQPVNTVAQTFIAASPHSLGPPIEPCAKYLRMEKCGQYGRDKLTIWRSPFLFPKVIDEEGSKKGFLDQQVTSIVWILQRFLGKLPRLRILNPETDEFFPETKEDEDNRNKLRGPKYSGGILADSMGLGKTLSCIACLELMAGQKLNRIRGGKKPNGTVVRAKHRPMAILAPNATVATQWIEEICQNTDPEVISKIITSGNGLQFRKHSRIRSLTAKEFNGKTWPQDVDYVWKDKETQASKTVIIMSIDTFASRTLKSSHGEAGQATYESIFTKLNRKFSVVVVDEAHKVKNDATCNWKSVALLDRQFTLLVTATPAINSLTDLMGPARLLWPRPSEYLKNCKPDLWKKMEEEIPNLPALTRLDDPKLEAGDDLRLVAGRPGLLAKMLCRNRGAQHDIQLIREYLKYFESLAILRRSPTSSLYSDWEMKKSVSLEGLFPIVAYNTVDIQLEPDLASKYQTAHLSLFTEYVKVVNAMQDRARKSDVQGKTVTSSVTRCHRLLQIASASLDVYNLDKLLTKNEFGTMSMHITTMRQARVDFPRLSQFLLEQDDPTPKVALDFLKIAIRRSPVLRYILYYINEHIIDERPEGKIKKLLITEASPILAYYYELVLQFLGFNCRTLHADLTQEDRKNLITDFNSDEEHTCQIMIQMYTVACAGSNLHRNCSRVLVASQATSLAVQWQAIHRVIRVGQMSDVQVHRIKVSNSYHSFRESRQVEKLLPELASRAEGTMKNVLVDILNLYQGEINDVWESPEGLKLVSEKNLLLDEYKSPDTNISTTEAETHELDNQGDGNVEQASKRQRLEDGSALPTKRGNEMATALAEAPSTPRSSPHENPKLKVERGSAGWFCHNPDKIDDTGAGETGFLAMMTRNDSYSDFKELPKLAKSHFSHEKSMLRRLLSYGTPNGNATTRIWTAQDLENPAVLERAIELMIRIRLGAGPIKILPLPQIDFALAPDKERITLQKQLAKVKHTEQDLEAARQQQESPKKGGVKETLPNDTSIDASCSEIERALDENSQLSESATPAAQMGKPKCFVNDPDDDDVDMEDIPAFTEENEGEEGPEENEPEEIVTDQTPMDDGLDPEVKEQDKDQTENHSKDGLPEKSQSTENDPEKNGQRIKNSEGGDEVNGQKELGEVPKQATDQNNGTADEDHRKTGREADNKESFQDEPAVNIKEEDDEPSRSEAFRVEKAKGETVDPTAARD